MFMAIMIAAFSMVACSSDIREDNIHEDTQKTLADYDGVWEDEDNDTLFISISANGNIKYYCGSIYMGNGIGVLNGNTLVVYNRLACEQKDFISSIGQIFLDKQGYWVMFEDCSYPYNHTTLEFHKIGIYS